MTAFSLSTLIEILVLCADLRGIDFPISLLTSSTLTSLKWKWELFAFLTAAILEWFLYFSFVLSVGSENLLAKELILLNLGILRFLTAFEKKIFKSSACCSSFVVTVSASTKVIFSFE